MSEQQSSLSRAQLDAALFDLDGVVTRTAEVHAAAWKRLFDEFLNARSARAGEDLTPFDAVRDYRRHVDGRPRYQGVKHFLYARHIALPMGEPEDPPERETVCGLGNRKNDIFRRLLEEDGVAVYDCAIDLIRRLRQAGIKTAVVSASKNCDLILAQAGISDLFDAKVDGVEAERLDLDGKPDPDTFLEAAKRLGVEPSRAAVLEDAVAGVTAGARGHFGLVIGVDRSGQRQALAERGAALVVDDLCDVGVAGADGDATPPPLGEFTVLSHHLRGKRPALFLDYDGTLTPIVARAEDARLSAAMRAILQRTAAVMPVAIISGRDLRDVRELVGLAELTYAGSHGFDIAGPDLRLEHPAGLAALDALDEATAALGEALRPIAGARLERKRFAVAVHHRLVGEGDTSRVEAAVRSVQARLPGLRLTGGKKVLELRPDIDWDKGRAVLWLLEEMGLGEADVLPLYLGDDATDEDAFRALSGRGLGILIAEGPQQSAADYRLHDPEAVAALLERLTEAELDRR